MLVFDTMFRFSFTFHLRSKETIIMVLKFLCQVSDGPRFCEEAGTYVDHI